MLWMQLFVWNSGCWRLLKDLYQNGPQAWLHGHVSLLSLLGIFFMGTCETVTAEHTSFLCLHRYASFSLFFFCRTVCNSVTILSSSMHFWLSGEMGQCDTSMERQPTTLPEHLPCVYWWGLFAGACVRVCENTAAEGCNHPKDTRMISLWSQAQ